MKILRLQNYLMSEMKQIRILFGANYCRNSEGVNRKFWNAKARIGEWFEGESNQDGDCVMPSYLKAKSPEDGWIRIVRNPDLH